MYLDLAHTKLEVYQASQALAFDAYNIARQFPPEEKFAMVQQLRRAGLSVHLNLAEGCSRKSRTERNRYFEIARGSVIEIDACLDIAMKLKYVNLESLRPLSKSIVQAFRLLSGMIK